jgi:hypothetical protein
VKLYKYNKHPFFCKEARKEMTQLAETFMKFARILMLLAGNPSVSLAADSSLCTREPFGASYCSGF